MDRPTRQPPSAPRLLLVLVWLCACNPPRELVRPEELHITRPGAEVLVVVYSRSGQTARAARALADELGGDYLRILGPGREGDTFFSTPSVGTRSACRPRVPCPSNRWRRLPA